MKMALYHADQALERYYQYGHTTATLFFELDLKDFIARVEAVTGETRTTRLMETYLKRFLETAGTQESVDIADEFFRDKLPDILNQLESQHGKA